MTSDREQMRLDAEEATDAFGIHDALDRVQVLAGYVLSLLPTLEQAERERAQLRQVAADALEWIERMDPMEAKGSEENLRMVLKEVR